MSKTKRASLEAEKTQLIETMTNLRNCRHELRQELKDAYARIANLEKELEEEHQNTRQELKEARARIKELEGELERTQDSYSKLL